MKRLDLILLAGLAAGVVALRWQTMVPWVIAYAIAISGITFGVYAYDKWAVGRSRSRIPERTLHVLALAGGSPAALISQQLFRHKTVKSSFRIRFWLIVAAQAAALSAWLYLNRFR